jgi:hypothetical protein
MSRARSILRTPPPASATAHAARHVDEHGHDRVAHAFVARAHRAHEEEEQHDQGHEAERDQDVAPPGTRRKARIREPRHRGARTGSSGKAPPGQGIREGHRGHGVFFASDSK